MNRLNSLLYYGGWEKESQNVRFFSLMTVSLRRYGSSHVVLRYIELITSVEKFEKLPKVSLLSKSLRLFLSAE